MFELIVVGRPYVCCFSLCLVVRLLFGFLLCFLGWLPYCGIGDFHNLLFCELTVWVCV